VWCVAECLRALQPQFRDDRQRVWLVYMTIDGQRLDFSHGKNMYALALARRGKNRACGRGPDGVHMGRIWEDGRGNVMDGVDGRCCNPEIAIGLPSLRHPERGESFREKDFYVFVYV
jgi:hypothetical protein